MRALILSLAIASLAVACAGAQPAREASLSVDVVDDQGGALTGIAILVDDAPVATTNGQGRARAIVQAEKSARVRVRAQCPQTYREAEARMVALSRADAQSAPLALRMTCTPKLRTLAVVVRAPGGEGLTLRADGVPIAKVGADGSAHVVVERAPDTKVRLSLDTAEHPKLLPQYPAREVNVTERDEIVVFDQAFATRTQPARRGAPKHEPPAEPRHVPYAIGR